MVGGTRVMGVGADVVVVLWHHDHRPGTLWYTTAQHWPTPGTPLHHTGRHRAPLVQYWVTPGITGTPQSAPPGTPQSTPPSTKFSKFHEILRKSSKNHEILRKSSKKPRKTDTVNTQN